MPIKKVNLSEKFEAFDSFWDPKIVGELNGQHVKVARLAGKFVMHNHEHEDELFFVIEGHLKIELEDGMIELNPGEFVIIPKGVNHKPIAKKEVKVMLFEPKSTLNTGNTQNDFTVDKLDEI